MGRRRSGRKVNAMWRRHDAKGTLSHPKVSPFLFRAHHCFPAHITLLALTPVDAPQDSQEMASRQQPLVEVPALNTIDANALFPTHSSPPFRSLE